MNTLVFLAGILATAYSAACPASSVKLACELLDKQKAGLLFLATKHQSGKSDNAYPLNNIKDMCDGKEAQRSSYSCDECKTSPAPGGTVCLSNSLLNYLKTLLKNGPVNVNELAGACHSCTSKHYQGLAVDLRNDARKDEYKTTCKSLGGLGIDEGNHIHCQFPQ